MLPQCSKHAPVKGTPPATLTKTLLVGVAEPVCNRIVTPIMQSVAFHTEPWRFPMKNLLNLAATALAAALTMPAQAQTEIQWWHSMGGALGEWVNDMAKDFNASQKDFKVVPTRSEEHTSELQSQR